MGSIRGVRAAEGIIYIGRLKLKQLQHLIPPHTT